MFSEYCSISALSCSFEFVWVWMGGCGWYSQRLLSLNPTTVMVVFLFGLWLLLGCDKSLYYKTLPHWLLVDNNDVIKKSLFHISWVHLYSPGWYLNYSIHYTDINIHKTTLLTSIDIFSTSQPREVGIENGNLFQLWLWHYSSIVEESPAINCLSHHWYCLVGPII